MKAKIKEAVLSELAISLHCQQINARFGNLNNDIIKQRILIELINPENLIFTKK